MPVTGVRASALPELPSGKPEAQSCGAKTFGPNVINDIIKVINMAHYAGNGQTCLVG
jgi:hypothetical protein